MRRARRLNNCSELRNAGARHYPRRANRTRPDTDFQSVDSERNQIFCGIKSGHIAGDNLHFRQTLANYAKLGAAGSFSGPIIRGDLETVSRHLRILAGNLPLQEVYAALAKTALLYLPSKNRRKLEKILQSRPESRLKKTKRGLLST